MTTGIVLVVLGMAARLPVRKDGQSVAELVAAANEQGVPLVAELVAESAALPRVPAIFHRQSNGESGGHFLFAMPIGVGPSADQWLLVDPPRGPEVRRGPELRMAGGYTGWMIRAAAWHERTATRFVGFAVLSLAAGSFWLRPRLGEKPRTRAAPAE
jgi:hypothetical protein